MSNILNSEDFGLKIYNRFPPKYREDDVKEDFALRNYLQVLSEGGFKYSIDEINGILNLIDPNNVDSKVLPMLFKQQGLEIFNGIPEQYLRYLLPKLGEAWTKKGSLSVLEFITSSLSGVKTSTEVIYEEGDENPFVAVRLEMDYNIGDYFPEAEHFNRLLKNFVPFYCDVILLYSYLFYESNVLRVREDSLSRITHTLGDSASFNLYLSRNAFFGHGLFGELLLGNIVEADSSRDCIIQTLKENAKISTEGDSERNLVSTKVIDEFRTLRGNISFSNVIKGVSYSDNGSFTKEDGVYSKYSISQTLKESSGVSKSGDTEKQVIKVKVISESKTLRGVESIVSSVNETYSDGGSFKSASLGYSNDAIFGNCVMGVAVMSVDSSVDYFEDIIHL